jgi:Tol biopolymer transport system component
MSRMTGILVLAVALVGCRPEPQPRSDAGQLLAAGLPSSTASASEAEQDSSPMVVRRLWFYPDGLDFGGGPSPDARYVTFVDWNTEDLAVHDFRTGENRQLTTVGSLPDSGYAMRSSFSPDGELVAYSWENPPVWNDELRIIGFDGSNPRVVIANEELDVHPVEWTADGTMILVSVRTIADGLNQIGIVSVESGSLQVLVTLDQRAPFEISISPDGRYVIYDFPSNEGSAKHDIFVVNVATREVRTLVKHPAEDRVLGWAPDGKHVLFASDRAGTLGAWLLPIADGEAVGSARLVKHELWRVRPLGFARNGSYFYGVPMNMPDVYVATLDVETGKPLLDHATPVSHSYFGGNGGAAWSPDGRYLAHISRRGLRGSFGTDAIVVRSTETGGVRELVPSLGEVRDAPRWSPDGRSFLVPSSDEMNREGLFRVDAQTGEVEPLIYHLPGERLMMARWHGDDKTLLLYVISEEGRAMISRISVRDLETDAEQVLYRAEAPGWIHPGFDRSPDGRQLAFALDREDGGNSLMVMPTAGGEPRELFRCDKGEPSPGSVQWSHDGRYVYYGMGGGPEEDPRRGFWRVPAGGGEPEQLLQVSNAALNLVQIPSFHPDGRRIAFTVMEGGGAEVWVIEDFLPATAGTSDEQ